MRPCLALCLLLLLPGVAPGSQVSGAVVDMGNTPFTDAALEVVRAPRGQGVARARTDAEGRFRFELPPGRYRLRVHTPELCAEHEKALEVEQGEDLPALPMQLPRCVRVTGRALGEGGAPLAGGRVTLHWLRTGEPDQSATADGAGRFEFPRVPQGAARVSLADATGRELLPTVRLTAPRELEVRGARMLQVLVRGTTGEPLEDAEVLLVPEARDGISLRRRTDTRGLAGLPSPPPGRYRLLASWERKGRFHRHVWREVELQADTAPPRLELVFTASPYSATLSGRVRALDGTPMPDVEVTAVRRSTDLPLDDDFLSNETFLSNSATTRTDAEGGFTLSELREGEYALSVEHPRGSGTALARTGAPGIEVPFVPYCARSATGRVVDERGAPVQRFKLFQSSVEDPEGRFHATEGCHLFIEAEGFLPRWVTVPASPVEPVSLSDVVLVRGRTLVGRVVHPDGAPEVGYTLTAEWPGALSPPRSKPTAADGRFSLGAIPRDTEVVLKSESSGRVLRRRVPPNLEGEFTFRLPALDGRLHVRALSATGHPLAGVEVTAEGADGTFRAKSQDSHDVRLKLPSGTYEVRVVGEAEPAGPRAGIPARFAPLKVRVPAKGTATLEARASQGAGVLRVLLPEWSHSDEIHVMQGVQPWPTDLGGLLDAVATLPADEAPDRTVDVAAPGMASIRLSYILRDYSQLAPGAYTVFAQGYGGAFGRSKLFRQVIEVKGPKRQVVQVRFDGPDARELPW